MYPKEIRKTGYTVVIIHEIEDTENDNIDVHVKLDSGEHYIGSLFTIANLQKLMQKNIDTGEYNSGQYLWASDMVIMRDLKEETILETIQYLIDKDEIHYTFGSYDSDEKKHKT